MGHNGIWHKGNGHWVLKKEALPPATDNIPSGQRPNMYDTSIKVPTAIRWPRVTQPGQVVTQTFTSLDWFPTMCAIAGVDLPEGEAIRGRNAEPMLRDASVPWDNDYYGEYSTKHQTHTHMRALRTDRWKLVRDFLNPERDELYDLKNDPGETENLIGSDSPKHRTVIDELTEKIVKRMTEVEDPVLDLTGQ